LYPDALHISRSLRKALRRDNYRVTLDSAFPDVMRACAESRPGQTGTWITADMQAAYTELHRLGYAHSVEIRMDGELVGGLYGVALGKVFFGESMFSRRTNGSKIALAWLMRQLLAWDFRLLDCQVASPHLARLGMSTLPRDAFLARLERDARAPDRTGRWQLDVTPVF
ncbi:MAG TPA: leucyl/phenylalanyl-tRNA--protein transferase, partial [Gammaproteobacteria bacterium]|nr:leucyl/phenylalanyl-tRNA--protein transferase [Gammaproteobacteria bacterium]